MHTMHAIRGQECFVQHVSALQVAKVLVLLHNELLQGSTECLERLRTQAPAGVSGSKQQTVSHENL